MENEKKSAKKAVALLYEQDTSEAPRVTASGSHLIADKIIATAKEAGVVIKEDKDLVELLSKVPLGQEIPSELYQTVAEVLAFVYSVNEKYKQS